MHPNPVFRKTSVEKAIRFARKRAFGTLAINAEEGPLLSHIPFVLSEGGEEAELHLVRSNPIVQLAKEPIKAVISVNGGDAYISPDWYGIDDQVPTWNYVAVHLRGELIPLPHDQIHDVLVRLSHEMETRLLPKKPWVSDKMDQTVYERMLRQIVPFKFAVNVINSTWKLNQNKPDEVRMRAADHVETSAMGIDLATLASEMRMEDG